MSFLSKRIDRRLATYQQELIETHYRKWTICTGRSVAGGTITGTTSRP